MILQPVRRSRFRHNSAWQEIGLVEVNLFLVPAWREDWDRRLIASVRGLDSGTCQWMVWLGSWDQQPASNRLEPLRREIRCTELTPNLSVIKVGVFICCPWSAFMSVPVKESWVENVESPLLTSQWRVQSAQHVEIPSVKRQIHLKVTFLLIKQNDDY